MPAAKPEGADEFGDAQRIRELEQLAAKLQRKLAQAKTRTQDLVDAVRQGARDAALITGVAQLVTAPKRDRRTAGEEVALLHLTDWQLGKATGEHARFHTERGVGFEAGYNSEVCAARVGMAVAKTIQLADIQSADHPVKTCHVMFGGDLAEGVSIFPGQAWEVDSSVFSQVFAAARIMEESLLSLLGRFETVEVWEVSGNHGRIGRKGDHPREDNWDRIIGRIVRERMEGQKRLVWHEPHGWHTHVEIGAYRALLVHGDQVKSFGGQVPAYGIIRKATAWASGVVAPFEDVYLGHFHQPLQFTLPAKGRVFVTPSTESGSEYAREFAAAQGRPGQRLHFVNPRKGRITSEHILWLDGVPS